MREILWPALASCELPAGGQMSVTTNILEAFLSCRTKALLYVEGAGGNLSEWGEWRLRSRQSFAREVSQRLCHALTDDEWHLGVPSVGALKQGRYQLILQCKLGTSEMSSDIDALQIDPPTRQAKVGGYIPIRFALNEKLTKPTSYSWPLMPSSCIVCSAKCRKLAESFTAPITRRSRSN